MASKPFHYAISTYMMLDAAATITSYCGLHAPIIMKGEFIQDFAQIILFTRYDFKPL